jgi:hypothetical protein
MLGYIDLYCERTAPGLWGEPFNVLSNLAFLLAAWRLCRSDPWRGGTWGVRLLVSLLALWHVTAQGWAMVADVLPIALFVSAYLLVFLLRMGHLSWPLALLVLLSFAGLHLVLYQSVPANFLNGSALYLPAVAAAGLIAGHMGVTAWPGARRAAWAAGVLAVSVFLRSIDLAACAALPLGTHFLWHLLNALALYLLIRALVPGAAVTASR